MVDQTNPIGPRSDVQSGEPQQEVKMDFYSSILPFLDYSPNPPDFCLDVNNTSSTNQEFNPTTWWCPFVQSPLLESTNVTTTGPTHPTLEILDGRDGGSQAFYGVNSLQENSLLSLSLTDPGASKRTSPGDPVAGETPFGAESRERILPQATKSQSRPVTRGNASLLRENDTLDWIALIKPLPQAGENVITFRRETHVALDITIGRLPGLPPAFCSGIKIPATGSVKNYADTTGKNLLEFRIRLYGAETKRRYETVCANCEKRAGKKKGTPNLVDFYAERDIIEPKDGKIRVEFSFCCYPKCHQSGDSGYLLEVVLSECMDQSRIVAQYQFAVSFNVLPRVPHGLKKPPPAGGKRNRRQMEQPEGARPVVDQRNIRPRFGDPSQRESPSDERADHPRCTSNPQDTPKCGLHHNSSPFGPSLLMPPLRPASSICSSPESLNEVIPLGQAMSPPTMDGESAVGSSNYRPVMTPAMTYQSCHISATSLCRHSFPIR